MPEPVLQVTACFVAEGQHPRHRTILDLDDRKPTLNFACQSLFALCLGRPRVILGASQYRPRTAGPRPILHARTRWEDGSGGGALCNCPFRDTILQKKQRLGETINSNAVIVLSLGSVTASVQCSDTSMVEMRSLRLGRRETYPTEGSQGGCAIS